MALLVLFYCSAGIGGYLRFGGAGNDGLPYALDMSDPSSNGNRCAAGGDGRCLNRTWTDNLANFARRSGAKLVFGLNVATCAKPAGQGKGKNRCAGQPWDPTEAEALMRYLIKANHSVYASSSATSKTRIIHRARPPATSRCCLTCWSRSGPTMRSDQKLLAQMCTASTPIRGPTEKRSRSCATSRNLDQTAPSWRCPSMPRHITSEYSGQY